MALVAPKDAIASVPAGAWAIGVSGGADSVALLLLLAAREDLQLHVVHLDHETRGPESTADADFVERLATRLRLSFTRAGRSEIEPTLFAPTANTSALYRACRLKLFSQVVDAHALSGVILAHHRNDQAETVLHRLLRGSGAAGLAGMSCQARIGDLRVVRPLLDTPRVLLREHLSVAGQDWREDASNQSDAYLRNRLRRVLGSNEWLGDDLVQLSDACAALREWTATAAPILPVSFATRTLANLPRVLAEPSARRWLIDRGVAPDNADPAAVDRLLAMAGDSASTPRHQFARAVIARRRKGRIDVVEAADG